MEGCHKEVFMKCQQNGTRGEGPAKLKEIHKSRAKLIYETASLAFG